MNFAYFTLERRRRSFELEYNPRTPVRVGRDFPQDMINEIMSRLHPKELCRLKIVSRGFNSLISGKSFSLNTINKMEALNRSVYIFQKEPAYAPLVYHISGVHRPDGGREVGPNHGEIRIVCSGDGLVLLCDTSDDFFLYSPVMAKSYTLNYCQHVYPPNSTSVEVFYGMGYIYDEDDFKIVRVSTYNNTEKSNTVMVYSRNSEEWHQSGSLLTHDAITQAGVNVCGCLHWITCDGTNRSNITSFNLETESYTTIEIPTIQPASVVKLLYGLDSKTLAICCSLTVEGSIHTVWILRDYSDNSSWYSIEINLATIISEIGFYMLRPLSLIYPERKKMLLRVDPTGNFLIYDIEGKEFNEVGYEEVGAGYMRAYRFIPSLRSPFPPRLLRYPFPRA